MFSYKDALSYLNGLVNYERLPFSRTFRLENTTKVLARMGVKKFPFFTFHIAGTKGKGSTANFLFHALKAHGITTGIFTSPHIFSVRERIATNDGMIREEDFALYAEKVKDAVDAVRKKEKTFGVSFFEFLTVLAIAYFAKKGVKVAVLEAGMGGRLDATNIVFDKTAVFTKIGIDHTEVLGFTKEEIAREKSGIVTPACTAVSCAQDADVLSVLARACGARKAIFYHEGRDYSYTLRRIAQEGTFFDFSSRSLSLRDLRIRLLGRHQAANAALALCALGTLKNFTVKEPCLREALAEAWLPARFQIVRRDPTVIVDGAHNSDSVAAVFETCEALFPGRKPIVVFGVAREKEIPALAELLQRNSSTVITTSFRHYRAVHHQKLHLHLGPCEGKNYSYDFAHQAIECAYDITRERDVPIMIVGSFHLAKEALGLFEPQEIME